MVMPRNVKAATLSTQSPPMHRGWMFFFAPIVHYQLFGLGGVEDQIVVPTKSRSTLSRWVDSSPPEMSPTIVVSSANLINRVAGVGGGAVRSVEGQVMPSVAIDQGLDYNGTGAMMLEKCWTSLYMNRKKPSSKMKQRSWHEPET